MFSSLLTAVLIFGSAPAQAAERHQLNIRGFAYCLAEAENKFDLKELVQKYRLGTGDLLLSYLAFYAGKRLPGPAGRIQDSAHARWAESWAAPESKLADFLAHVDTNTTLTPATIYREALKACEPGDIFCAALLSHNVLRTLGRYKSAVLKDRDLNPEWFKSRREFWVLQSQRLEASMVALRSGPGGERFGEWYHFFGMLAFSIRDQGLRHSLSHARLVALFNKLLNPVLTGAPETAEKAQLDRDSVAVAGLYLHHRRLAPVGGSPQSLKCSVRDSYAAVPPNPYAALMAETP